MKPKTKLQLQVASLQKTLKPISKGQKSYGIKHCFEKRGVFGKTTAVCFECGESFIPVDLKTDHVIKCPCCGEKIKLKETRARKDSEVDYYCILSVLGGFQVSRVFHIRKTMRIGTKATFQFTEVMQHFFNEKGDLVLFSRTVNAFGNYGDAWVFQSDLEIRNHNNEGAILRSSLGGSVIYKKWEVLPNILRNGFKGDCHNISPFNLFTLLLKDSKVETLLKSGQYSLLRFYCYGYRYEAKQLNWSSIRICIRNKYIVQDARQWVDYISQLERLGKDVFNAHYVCPADFHRAHQDSTALLRARDERARQERENQNQLETKVDHRIKTNEDFELHKGKFFGLRFTQNDLTVTVLKSIEDFKAEGDALNHCVYTNEYYRKENTLVLSAKINGVPTETVEVSLATKRITQSRGYNNLPTDHHERIVDLVNTNLNKILKLA